MDANFPSVEFADNPEPRCPVVLLIDCSGSMAEESIDEVNEGLKEFETDIKSDNLASLRVEVAIVTFGGVVKVLDLRGDNTLIDKTYADAEQVFVSAMDFTAPLLKADGLTPMGEAVQVGLKLLRERKDIYRRNGIDFFRPWMFLITDGSPTDMNWQQAAESVKYEESRKGVSFYGVATGPDADIQKLSTFSSTPPLRLKGLAFKEMFVWLSKSLATISQSRPGDQVPLPPTNWGNVDTSSS